jgi:3-dehydroquinate synthetase
VAPRPEWPADELVRVMHGDKKAEAGRLRFILPVCLGEVRLFDAGEAEALQTLRQA